MELVLRAIADSTNEEVNLANAAGWTPLRLAVATLDDKSAHAVSCALLQRSADQELRDHKSGLLPIHEATRRGLQRTVRLLVEQNPRVVHRANCFGMLPVHYAAQQTGDVCTRCNKRGQGEVIDGVFHCNKCMNYAAANSDEDHDEDDLLCVDLLRLLVDCTDNAVGQGTAEMLLPLHYAVWNERMVHLLLERGGENVDALTRDGNTPAHYAGATGHAAVMQLLLQRGNSRDLRNHAGWRPEDKLRAQQGRGRGRGGPW